MVFSYESEWPIRLPEIAGFAERPQVCIVVAPTGKPRFPVRSAASMPNQVSSTQRMRPDECMGQRPIFR